VKIANVLRVGACLAQSFSFQIACQQNSITFSCRHVSLDEKMRREKYDSN
jgi:hypothetical protein